MGKEVIYLLLERSCQVDFVCIAFHQFQDFDFTMNAERVHVKNILTWFCTDVFCSCTTYHSKEILK